MERDITLLPYIELDLRWKADFFISLKEFSTLKKKILFHYRAHKQWLSTLAAYLELPGVLFKYTGSTS